MPTRKTINSENVDRLIADSRRYQNEREKTYREQALKLYPWVCGRCAREFNHANLRELTVHHKDHNHDNNPSDGSNWELLCLYCHDNEHSRYEETRHSTSDLRSAATNTATHNPFAGLDVMLKNKK